MNDADERAGGNPGLGRSIRAALVRLALGVAGTILVIVGARISIPSGRLIVLTAAELLERSTSVELDRVAMFLAPHVGIAIAGLALNVVGVAMILRSTGVGRSDPVMDATADTSGDP